MRKRFELFRCDRCGKTANYELLAGAQSDRWQTYSVKPVGSADDHPNCWNRDLCPDCSDNLLEWADQPFSEGATA